MGNDGHTASFFPGGDTLAEALDPHTDTTLIAISAPGAGEPRLTYTLPALLAASALCLHIEGQEKNDSAAPGRGRHGCDAMPIRAVLASAERPLIFTGAREAHRRSIHVRRQTISAVTEQLVAQRSKPTPPLSRPHRSGTSSKPARKSLGCANLAHGFAACGVRTTRRRCAR